MEKQESENYIKAGKIASEIREYLRTYIKPGMKLVDIAKETDKKIKQANAKPAFPINLSLNEIAAHYTPSIDEETSAEGILKVDFGVEIDGYIADLAFTLDLTKEKKYQEMIDLNQEILKKTLEKLNYESSVSDIGNSIHQLLENQRFNIIKNLTGHSLAQYNIHADISIPNTKNSNKTRLQEKAIAVEPFLTTGDGEVIEGKPSEIYMLINKKNVRDPNSKKLLNFIEQEYQTKPFCKRWLDEQGFRTNFSLKLLTKEEIVYNFPVLVEKSKQPVSQAEETIIFHNQEKIITTNQKASN